MAESASYTRLLDEAERIFLERGYGGTRLAEVANALGIKTASLYHHAPGGKKELWRLVVDRALGRHREGLRRAATQGSPRLREQLVAMTRYLIGQPPVNVVHLAATSGPQDVPDGVPHISERLYTTLMLPIRKAYQAAQDRGEVSGRFTVDMFAGVFLSAANGLVAAAHAGSLPGEAETLAEDMVDLLLVGAKSAGKQID